MSSEEVPMLLGQARLRTEEAQQLANLSATQATILVPMRDKEKPPRLIPTKGAAIAAICEAEELLKKAKDALR